MEGEVVKNPPYPVPDAPEPVAIASSLIPYDRDDEKAMYLGYRACGFSVREALQLIQRSKAWLSGARHDEKFLNLENRIPEIRKDVSKEYVEIEFFRNFRLVLEKDYQVLQKSLGLVQELNEETGQMQVAHLTPSEASYLIRMRAQYTPQQLGIIEVVVKGSANGEDFTKWVAEHQDIIKVSRTESVTMRKVSRSEEDSSE